MDKNTQQIKCVIWDLDNTVWEGVLSEGGAGVLKPGVEKTILELDRRGIIQSVSSKNDFDNAKKVLEERGLWEYFLCPQISWNNKSEGIGRILDLLNIKPEATAFVDDSAFERDEVRYVHPNVRVYDALETEDLPEKPEFQVRFITEDAVRRREMYRADLACALRFDSFLEWGEDFDFNMNYYHSVHSAALVEEPIYHYVKSPVSTSMRTLVHVVHSCQIKARLYHSFKNLYVEKGLYQQYKRTIDRYIYNVTLTE